MKKDNGEIVQFLSKENKNLQEVALPSLQSDELNYTHLRADTQGALAVRLLNGKSRETEVVAIASQKNAATALFSQASAQLHPVRTEQNLFYSHVACRVCDPIIQDVWRRNVVSDETQQLTLLNATSYLHSVDADEQFGYISSNSSGYYHVARLNLLTGDVVWLTSGQVTDSYPSIASNTLYFIRRDQQGTRLMRLPVALLATDANATNPEAVPLPKSVQKIRYLEISAQ